MSEQQGKLIGLHLQTRLQEGHRSLEEQSFAATGGNRVIAFTFIIAPDMSADHYSKIP